LGSIYLKTSNNSKSYIISFSWFVPTKPLSKLPPFLSNLLLIIQLKSPPKILQSFVNIKGYTSSKNSIQSISIYWKRPSKSLWNLLILKSKECEIKLAVPLLKFVPKFQKH
jgi:hypothetical protein